MWNRMGMLKWRDRRRLKEETREEIEWRVDIKMLKEEKIYSGVNGGGGFRGGVGWGGDRAYIIKERDIQWDSEGEIKNEKKKKRYGDR